LARRFSANINKLGLSSNLKLHVFTHDSHFLRVDKFINSAHIFDKKTENLPTVWGLLIILQAMAENTENYGITS